MTTSHTPRYGWPYPEGDEYVIGGDDAIEALAKAIEASLTPAYCLVHEHPGASLQSASAGGVTVLLNQDGHDKTAEFAISPDAVVTYSGPARPFRIDAGLTITGVQGAAQEVQLLVNDLGRATSIGYAPSDTAGFADHRSHALSWSGILTPGAVIRMTAKDGSDSPIIRPRLYIASSGPRG